MHRHCCIRLRVTVVVFVGCLLLHKHAAVHAASNECMAALEASPLLPATLLLVPALLQQPVHKHRARMMIMANLLPTHLITCRLVEMQLHWQ